MAPLIRVIGSLTVDHVSITSRFPGPGETVAASSFFTNPGGKGANQAVACGRLSRTQQHASPNTTSGFLGLPVTVEMVGAVGCLDAHFPTTIKPALESSGVDTSSVRIIDDAYTGVTMIIVDSSAGGENRILFSGRANHEGMQPTPEVIGTALAAPVPDVIVMQGEIPVETVIGILREIAALKKKNRENGKAGIEAGPEVIYNPAPVPPGGVPLDVWAGVDHLIMNETEAEQMMPSPEQLAQYVPATDQLDEKDKTARYFHKLGVTYVIITLGARGAWYSVTDGGSLPGPVDGVNRFSNQIPAAKVSEVIDTTAAGDTFVGGYTIQTARWREKRRAEGKAGQDLVAAEEKAGRYQQVIESAMQFAARAAAKCVERPGAMGSIPWGDEI